MPAGPRHIILGVSGSIAAYKACGVLRGLTARGHEVRAVMSAAAQRLVAPATFRSLSGRPVATTLWPSEEAARLVHIELAEWADALAVVPATADIIGKAACGIADEILSTTWMACDCPKVIAPAMNDRMWLSRPVQRNVAELRDLDGVLVVEPVEGRLASGKLATGHLAPVERIVEVIASVARGMENVA
jgi:phosphopantothenoylcysteine decarboxylase/phosphopantothenate--cysteine ligase